MDKKFQVGNEVIYTKPSELGLGVGDHGWDYDKEGNELNDYDWEERDRYAKTYEGKKCTIIEDLTPCEQESDTNFLVEFEDGQCACLFFDEMRLI